MEKRNIKNLRIIKTLLGRPKGDISKYRIAKLAGCSTSWALNFLEKLEGKKLVKKNKVMDFDGLVDYYIETMPKLKYYDFYVKEPADLLKKSNLEYALTTYAAENLTGHHLFPSRYDMYINAEDIDRWKSLIIKNGLLGKGNLRLIIANDKNVLKESELINGIRTVVLPQLLIDLKREGGVCLEAYKMLVKRHVQGH